MIRFHCPRCDAALKAPDGRAGQSLTCPKCQRAITVPESLDDEPPATSRDTPEGRRVPVWVWAVAALMFVGIGIAVVVLAVRSESVDGMTRAERAAFEAKFRSDLVGVWEASESSERQGASDGSLHLFTFTEEGRFEAVRYRDGKKAGGHVGRWSVAGQRLAIEVTESGDDAVSTTRIAPASISEVKSDKGRMFRFGLNHSQLGNYSKFTRWVEPPKQTAAATPAVIPVLPPAPAPAFTQDDLAVGQYLQGSWVSHHGTASWAWTFGFADYTVQVQDAGTGALLGTVRGNYYVEGPLQMNVASSTVPGVSVAPFRAYRLSTSDPNSFVLFRIDTKEQVGTFQRNR